MSESSHLSKIRRLFFAALRLSPAFLVQTQIQLSGASPLPSESVSAAVYEAGGQGSYPLYYLPSAPDVISPRFNFVQKSASCRAHHRGDDARYILVAPRGGVAPARPMMFDEDGNLVWSGNDDNGNAYGFRKQTLKGQPVLTYWTGDDQIRGHGSGEYHILDQSYNIVQRIRPGNGLEGDLHEFLITDDDTALMTIYEQRDADLSSVGDTTGRGIWDSLFQEQNLETGEVLFQWRATDHLNFTDTFRSLNSDGMGDDHWDWFHINSVQKDVWGNFLISARYTRSLMYIDGRDGHIIWNLGGRHNDFTDLSGGPALSFVGQHDARWQDNYTTITFFDNGADYDSRPSEFSRGLKLAVDMNNRTVDLMTEYIDPGRTLSVSQGSMQVLSNGNVLLGYGFNAYLTEFDQDGNALCDMHITPKASEDSGDVQTYRAYKDSWQGFPAWPPSVAVSEGLVYVSWNGATEIATWVLKTGTEDLDPENWRVVESVPKSGFETHMALYRGQVPEGVIKAVALDAHGAILGETAPIEFDEEELFEAPQWSYNTFLLPAGLTGTALMIYLVMKTQKHRTDEMGEYSPLPQ